MSTAIIWFRSDLRLADNPALQALLQDGHRPLAVYIHDKADPDWPLGSASAWWLHHSLVALRQSLLQLDSDLLIFSGDAQQQLSKLIEHSEVKAIYWNRCYKPALARRDATLKAHFKQRDINVHDCNASFARTLATPEKRWHALPRVHTILEVTVCNRPVT